MIASKTATLLAMAALLPALFAAEPDTPTSADVVQPVPSSPEAIAEQAALVRQIGADAARGFDPEAHAHALRVQIETLVKEPSVPPAPLLTKPPAPAVAPPDKKERPSAISAWPAAPESAVRLAIQKVRAALAELEAQLNAPAGAR